MNLVIVKGRLTKDIVVNTTGVKPVGKFTIAVNRDFKNKEGKYDADFINCVAFDKRAEVLSQYVKKGQEVLLKGNWRTGSYDKDGVKVYTNELFVDSFDFIGQSNNSSANNDTSCNSNDTTWEEVPPVYGEEMPF